MPSDNLKEITSEFDELAKSLGITVDKLIKNQPQKRQFIAMGLYMGRPVTLKTFSRDDQLRTTGLLKEKALLKILLDNQEKLGISSVAETPVISNGETSSFNWVLREYCPGKVIGNPNKRSTQILWKTDLVRPEFMDKNEIIDNIILSIKNFRSIPTNLFENKGINLDKYFPDDIEHDIQSKELCAGCKFDTQLAFYNQHKKDFLENKNLGPAIGDLVPPNILVQKNNHIVFIDLERFCIDNYLTDTIELWLFLWRYPEWQKKIIQQLVNTEKDRVYFRTGIIRRIINSNLFGKFKDYEDRTASGFAWVRYLKAAGESFEAIMSVK